MELPQQEFQKFEPAQAIAVTEPAPRPESPPQPEPRPEAQPAPRSAAVEAPEDPWFRHDDERWVVEDEGRQPLVRPAAPTGFRTPPPEAVIDAADLGTLSYRAASIRGISHQERGEPRQDAFAVRFTQDQSWLVGCIADGVSAGRRSHEAAAAIAEQVTSTLVTHLSRTEIEDRPGEWGPLAGKLPWQPAIDAANEAVVALARDQLKRVYTRQGDEEKLRELEQSLPYAHVRSIMSATALVFVIATAPSPGGAHRALLANIAGDSSAFLLQRDTWLPLSEIKNEGSEIFSGTVKSLPNDVEPLVRPFFLTQGDAFVVMTDGLGDPLGGAKGTVGAFLRQKWRTPPDSLAFAQHLAFYKKSFTDDRTAVMVWSRPAAGAPA